MTRVKKTVAQAIISYLKNQYTERDGQEEALFAGCMGIFGHGNVAGIGQALLENPDFIYRPFKNEQAMVHAAVAFSRVKNRMSTYVCTSSIGPGATNMITGAALATINHLPVLLLPGDYFSKRHVSPLLQQLESQPNPNVSVNDCFKPVSRYWDRIARPEQLLHSLPQAVSILSSPCSTGAVTISLPQDVQVEAYDFPKSFFDKKVWTIPRQLADRSLLSIAVRWIKSSKRPVIISGGGVKYSAGSDSLAQLISSTDIPVVETMAGKGTIHHSNFLNLGSTGVTGTPGGVYISQTADLVIGIGTRYTDFTTSSHSLFQNEKVRFININISQLDSHKMNALSLISDAKATIEELSERLKGWSTEDNYVREIRELHDTRKLKVNEIYNTTHEKFTQVELIGVINNDCEENDIMINASGSLPGDLHKLWQSKNPYDFHVEYGYSCMGYEIPGGIGAKLANPNNEIFVLVGDGSYLMMPQEIATSIQENTKLIIVLINNGGYKSIGSLSRSIGNEGFGTRHMTRSDNSLFDDRNEKPHEQSASLVIDFVKNAESLGSNVLTANTKEELSQAIQQARQLDKTTLIYCECDRYHSIEDNSWWEVPIAEVSSSEMVKEKYQRYLEEKKSQRYYKSSNL